MDEKGSIKKTIMRIIVFFLLIVLTFIIIFRDQDFFQILDIAIHTKFQYILIAILAMCLYFSAESLNVARVLKGLGTKTSFLSTMKYSLIGYFFSAITPAATGGQPVEAYYMTRDNISLSHAMTALLVQLCCFQTVTISFGIISAINNYELMQSGLIYFFIIGIFFNSIALTLFTVALFLPKVFNFLVKFAISILKFFKVKNLEDKKAKLLDVVSSYEECAVYIKSHKLLMLKCVLTTIFQMLCYYSVPFWVYKAMGIDGTYNLWNLITLQGVLYASVSGIPSPGAVGVSEGGFFNVFKGVFPEFMISSAMLLSRGISFYLVIFVCAVVVIIASLKDKKTSK